LVLLLSVSTTAHAVRFHTGDGSIDGSLAVGLDTPATPSFGFTTLLLMENNLRIKFDDTSSSASFPRNDWSLEANESSNGGRNAFFLRDCGTSSQGNCSGNAVFTVEAGARNNALYVEDDGDIGIGTSTPAVDVHVQTGNTPTYRLAQDGSSGFTPQTWDVAGNETNFFIRDATNGSTLPLRIRPSAPTSSIDISGSGDVGVGTSSPGASLHVARTQGPTTRTLVKLSNNGRTRLELENTNVATGEDNGRNWIFDVTDSGVFSFIENTAPAEFKFSPEGNLTITGNYFSATCTSPGLPCAPDYVFEPDYKLMPMHDLATFIEQEGHLPKVPSAEDIKAQGGVNMTKMQMTLLEKIEELTLYTLKQEETIRELQSRLVELEQSSHNGR
jgi:hypothetical protein